MNYPTVVVVLLFVSIGGKSMPQGVKILMGILWEQSVWVLARAAPPPAFNHWRACTYIRMTA